MSHVTILRTLSIAILVVFGAATAGAQTVQVSIPDTTAKKGDTLLIPIRVPSLTTSDSVYSGEFTLSYDGGVIDIFGIETAGTIAASVGSILYNTTTRRLAFANASVVTGSGAFVYLKTRVLANPTRDTTTIFFPETSFNEGTPAITLTRGKFRVLSIRISPKSPPSTLVEGDSLQFSVSGDQVLPLTWTSSDEAVGTVDANGKFRALAAGQAKVYVEDSRGLKDSTDLFPVYPAQARSLTVSIHDTSHTQTLYFNLPIYVSDVTSLNIISAQLNLNFSSSRLQAVDVIAANSMTSGWSSPSFNITSGQIEIALAGAQPLTGSGVLAFVRMRVLASASGVSTISFSNVLFNENLNANTVSGQFTPLTAPTVVVSPASAILARGDTLRFTVTSGGTPPYQWSPSNPAVASIDPSTGLLTAVARGTTTVTVVDYFGFMGTSGTVLVNDVRVSLPDTAVWPADSIDVPIFVDDVTGLEIYSFEARVKYNSGVVRSLSVVNTGTLSGAFSISYKDTLDTLRIAAATPGSALSGSGTLLKLRFRPAPGQGAGVNSPLIFTQFQFNEPGPNTPTATTRNGSLSIVDSAAVPVLASPSDGATGVSANPTLIWNSSAGASSYGIQVSTDANFSTLVVNQAGVSTTSLAPSGLLNNTTYFWRVNASNAGGTTAFSASRSFTTIIATPTAPVLAVPSNGATGISTSLTLRWNRSNGASSYRLQLSTDSDFLTIVLDSSNIPDTLLAVSSLSNNLVYFWRVNASNAGGTSPYSAPFQFWTTTVVPAAPVLIAPADGATGVPLLQGVTPILRWNQPATAFAYRVQVSLVSDFSTTVIDSTFYGAYSYPADTSILVDGLTHNTLYFWRVNATNLGGTGPFSTPFQFTTIIAAPAAPVLVSPPDGATGVSMNPTLRWNRSATATSYRVQLALFDFSGGLVDSTVTDTSLAVQTYENNFIYYWRVSASNAGGSSPFASASFTTIIAAPDAPVLVAPADGATGLSVSPTLRWNHSATASSYRVQVTLSSFSTSLVDSSLADTSLALSGLLNSTNYYWRVEATNAGGSSPYSNFRSFTTIIAAPDAPVLAAPSDGATGVSTDPTLSWNPLTGALSYRVQLSLASDFSTTVIDSSLTDISIIANGLLNSTTYYWRVNASNEGGAGAYSGSRSFTTIIAAPAAPVLVVPADAATGVSINPMLRWNQSATASSYRVQVSTASDFSTAVLDSSGVIDTSLVVSGLSNNTTYFWHVNAANAGGTSSYSGAFQFTTLVAAPAAPALAFPTDGETGVSTTPTLKWNGSTGASSYRVQVSTASDFSTTVLDSSGVIDTSVVVSGLLNNTTYFWHVNAANAGGTSSFSSPWSFRTSPPTSAELLQQNTPKEFQLEQNYPNPFNPSTSIRFGLPVQSFVRLTAYDIIGNEIGTIVAEERSAGIHEARFSATNLASGVYFYKLEAVPRGEHEGKPFVRIMKMILLK